MEPATFSRPTDGPQPMCPEHTDVYEDLSRQDSTECSICKDWWHEASSSYEVVGMFKRHYC
jgi:hypothetical protein